MSCYCHGYVEVVLVVPVIHSLEGFELNLRHEKLIDKYYVEHFIHIYSVNRALSGYYMIKRV